MLSKKKDKVLGVVVRCHLPVGDRIGPVSVSPIGGRPSAVLGYSDPVEVLSNMGESRGTSAGRDRGALALAGQGRLSRASILKATASPRLAGSAGLHTGTQRAAPPPVPVPMRFKIRSWTPRTRPVTRNFTGSGRSAAAAYIDPSEKAFEGLLVADRT